MTEPTWQTPDGAAQLYLGDCLQIIPGLGKVDACIADPPYGIGHARNRKSQASGWVDYDCPGWDIERPKKEIFDLIISQSSTQIIWGANYFTDFLSPSMQWLVWDKGQRSFSLADCEFAWSSQNKASRIFNYSRALALMDNKVHPTQKPIALMCWCLSFIPKAETILDPYCGSGSTGCACMQLGRRFIGIEIEPKYFAIAKDRIMTAWEDAQNDLFKDQQQEILEQGRMF